MSVDADFDDPFEPMGPEPTPEEWDAWGREAEALLSLIPDNATDPPRPLGDPFSPEENAAAIRAVDAAVRRLHGPGR